MGTNAYFRLITKADGVFLEFFPPKDGGEMLAIGEVTAYLGTRNLNNYDLQELSQAVNDAEHEHTVKVGVPGSAGNVDEVIHISVYQDKMHAYARFYPPVGQGKLLTAQDIIAKLKAEGIKAGINQQEILSFLKDRKYCTNYVLAQGIPPVEGHDAKIQYFFNTDVNLKPKRNEDGTVDYKELNMISHVEAGQKIAQLIKEDPGKPGVDVFGTEIKPHTVKTRKMSFGNNVTLSEDQTIMYSNVTGHASLVGGKVFVSDVYEVAADVDNSTGNIEYSGNVEVRGNVKSGFKVVAKGDIIVEGIVEDATLISDGQIIVKRGIHGMNKGLLQAKGNIICKFIENANVVSGGYVDAEAILHSKVDALGEVIVNGKKGFITGGVIRAGNLIEAKTIGSEMETATQVEVGVDPIQKERYSQVQKQLKENQEQIEKIKPIVLNYTSKMKQGQALSKEQVNYVKQLVMQMQKLQAEAEPLKAEEMQLGKIISIANSARIKVSKTIYSGVTVSISDVQMTLKDKRNFSQFVRQDGEIKIIPL